MDLSTITGLLAALLLPTFAINYIVQNYLDKQDWWNKLTAGSQALYELLASIVVAIAAYAALHLIPTDIFIQLQPIYQIIYMIVSAWLGGQIGHQVFIRGELRAARISAEVCKIEVEIKQLRPNG